MTDDAGTVEAGRCQLETWALLTNQGDQWWALPACNLFADVELTLGIGLGPRDDRGPPRDINVLVQAKKTLLKRESVSLAVVAGDVVSGSPDPEQNDFGQGYVYVPTTLAVLHDLLDINLDAGVAYAHTGGWEATWGVAPVVTIAENLDWEGEIYGASSDRPFLQLGFRYEVLPEYASLIATYGRQLGRGGSFQWAGIGFKITTPELSGG